MDLTILAAYRRNPNLRDLLVCSRIPKDKNPRIGNQNSKIKQHGENRAYYIPKIPLNTPNCVYVITCMTCKKQYVGQTKNAIRTRLHQHRYNIRANKGRHINRTLIAHFRRHGIHKLHIRGV
ncbi:MAG: GIY-YIG nuclease family protein, partial [Plesiomonas sp.]